MSVDLYEKLKSRPRHFQFSLRTMLIAVTLCSVILGCIGRLGGISTYLTFGIMLLFFGMVTLLFFTIFQTAVFIDERISRKAAIWLSPIYSWLWAAAFLNAWDILVEPLERLMWQL